MSSIQRNFQSALIYLLLIGVLLLLILGAYESGLQLVHLKPETLTWRELPWALVLSLMRMTISYFLSLVLAYALGMTAAKTAWGERVIIPLLDILQSVPVVAFFPAAISFFIGMWHGQRIGIEMAAIFLIVTSQAWNMAFAVYEAIKGLPEESEEAVLGLGLTRTQRFFKLYAPASVPRLISNSILSWSNGWFFLVACEIIAVGPVEYNLPGIGSFLKRAADNDDLGLVGAGLLALSLLILGLDYWIWRPIAAWGERFRYETSSTPNEDDKGRFLVLPRALSERLQFLRQPTLRLLQILTYPFVWTASEVVIPLFFELPTSIANELRPRLRRFSSDTHPRVNAALAFLVPTAATFTLLAIAARLGKHLLPPWTAGTVSAFSALPRAVLYSTGRLIIALLLSLLWILPLVYWTWSNRRVRIWLNTIAQVGASLPATALFPVIMLVAVRKFGGGMEFATVLLLMTGMQWYILFNCLGGVSIIPSDLIDASRSLGLSRYQLWKKLVLPAMRPAFVTGLLTAWGGGWNALVVSEYVEYRGARLKVPGLGSLVSESVYESGDLQAMILCVTAMIVWIILLNTLFWKPLYRNAFERYRIEG